MSAAYEFNSRNMGKTGIIPEHITVISVYASDLSGTSPTYIINLDNASFYDTNDDLRIGLLDVYSEFLYPINTTLTEYVNVLQVISYTLTTNGVTPLLSLFLPGNQQVTVLDKALIKSILSALRVPCKSAVVTPVEVPPSDKTPDKPPAVVTPVEVPPSDKTPDKPPTVSPPSKP